MTSQNLLTRLLVHNLFLRSHGIRDPLTVIRWGIERLRSGHLPPKEQKHFIDEISAQTRILSAILESSLLIEELQEKAYVPQEQDVCLLSFLHALSESFDGTPHRQWTIECPHIHVSIDRHLLKTILLNLLTAGVHFSSDPIILSLQAQEEDGAVRISIYTLLVVPSFLAGESSYRQMPTLIVGPSGLLISLADTLAGSCKGTIVVEKKQGGNFVAASSLADDDLQSTAKHYRLVCRLNVPVQAVQEDVPCGSMSGRIKKKDPIR